MNGKVLRYLALGTSMLLAQSANAQSALPQPSTVVTPTTTMEPAADNTRSNRADRTDTMRTADQQKNDARDVDLTKRVRQSVMDDKTLSTYGHNVKIVSVDGAITLNGVVRSDAEKTAIGIKAAAIAGKEHVANELTVEPPK